MQGAIPITSSSPSHTTNNQSGHWNPPALPAMSQGDVNSVAAAAAAAAAAPLPPAPYGLDHGYSTPSTQQQPHHHHHHHYNTTSFPYVATPSSSSVGGPSSSSSHRPRSGGYSSSSSSSTSSLHRPSYLSEIPPPPSMPLQYNPTPTNALPMPRQDSLASSSLTSHDDYTTSPVTWSHSQSPSLAGSRNNSIYGLDGQLGNLAVGAAVAVGTAGASTTALDASHIPLSAFEASTPQHLRHLSYNPSPLAHPDRRFSLDDRRSTNPRNPHLGINNSVRVWPWGGATSSQMPSAAAASSSGAIGITSSLSNSALPLHSRASYDYGITTSRSPLHGSNGGNGPAQDGGSLPWQGYDGSHFNSSSRSNPLNMDHQSAPARIRPMSSGGPVSGRAHPYAPSYGPGQSAISSNAILFGGSSSPTSVNFDPSSSSSASKLKIFPASQSPSAAIPSTIPPGIGPGGGVTRRTKFKRSRAGCLVCRKRKVKCSQDGTPCRQCRIGKRDCYYQEEPSNSGKGRRKDSKGRRESLISLGGTEDGSEDESDEDEEEEVGDSSFNSSFLTRGSHPEEQLHNFGGPAPVPRYAPLYPASTVQQVPLDQQQQPAPAYDSAVRGAVEFHMPFQSHSTPQHQLQHSPHQQQTSTYQHQQQQFHHPNQATTGSIDSSVRSVGSAGSIGAESSFDTVGSAGPNSIGSVGGEGPLHKADDQGRNAGAAGGGGGWYDPVAAVLRGEDAQSRYF